ncbi:MAG: mechanosensitive ion channel [Flavobacterium sp.]|nr:MAG: mechanosensitive ion channel [Flavobacterium sp.]
MEKFTTDILQHIESYYNWLVATTPKLILAIIAMVASWFIASKLQQLTGRKLKKKMHDPLLALFISRLFKILVLVFGIVLVLRIVGLTGIATSLLAGAGISAFIIGFALKDIGENFLAGIILAFKRPFSVGDIIEIDGIKGIVVSLNLRDTQVTWSGKNIFIPNGNLINNPLINFTRLGVQSQDFMIGIEYGCDYDKAIELIAEVVKKTPGVLCDETHEASVNVSDVSINSVTIDIYYWVSTTYAPGSVKVRSDVIIAVLKTLEKNGFNIPKNVVELKNYDDSVAIEQQPKKENKSDKQ